MRIGKDSTMRSTKFLTLSAVLGIVCLATLAPMVVSAPAESGVGPHTPVGRTNHLRA